MFHWHIPMDWDPCEQTAALVNGGRLPEEEMLWQNTFHLRGQSRKSWLRSAAVKGLIISVPKLHFCRLHAKFRGANSKLAGRSGSAEPCREHCWFCTGRRWEAKGEEGWKAKKPLQEGLEPPGRGALAVGGAQGMDIPAEHEPGIPGIPHQWQ